MFNPIPVYLVMAAGFLAGGFAGVSAGFTSAGVACLVVLLASVRK